MGGVGRRRFLAGAGALLASARVRAQTATRLPSLGLLSPHNRPTPTEMDASPLIVRLRQLGWVEGKTYHYVSGHGWGREDRLGELAADLVRKGVDVIYANGPEAAVAAARATKTIPIVFWGVAAPVQQELVQSLARPGGNVTGVAWHSGPEVDQKRVGLLREIAPGVRRLAHFTVPTAATTVSGKPFQSAMPATRATAESLGFSAFRAFPVAAPADLEPAFREIREWGADSLVVSGTTLTVREQARFIGFANGNRLPAIYTLSLFAAAGGLVAYAIDFPASAFRAAEYVDRIFRGAKPAEMPVEIPTKYELAVNLKTATALGLAVPPSLLLRADIVHE